MAMDKSSADTYVYAKASGMLAKSFVNKRANLLFSVRSLRELWSLLFKKEVPMISEPLLAQAIEKEACSSFISQYTSLLKNYDNPSPILPLLLQSFDYENLKEVSNALNHGQKEVPGIQPIEHYNILKYSAWPDIKEMTKNTPLSWYTSLSPLEEQAQNDSKIDFTYLEQVWSAVNAIKTSCRQDVISLIREKIQFETVLWALRLRIYYNMTEDEIIPKLFKSATASDLLSPAKKTFSLELDNYSAWQKWKFSSYLNPYEEGAFWSLDPVWLSNSYKKHYVNRARHLFHKHPFTECPLFCFFIIKRNELELIRTAAESLRLNVGSAQAMKMAGVQEEGNG